MNVIKTLRITRPNRKKSYVFSLVIFLNVSFGFYVILRKNAIEETLMKDYSTSLTTPDLETTSNNAVDSQVIKSSTSMVKPMSVGKGDVSVNSMKEAQNGLKSDIIDRISRGGTYGAGNLWKDIINKGVEFMEKNNYENNLVVFEVGAQKAQQSMIAAKQKLHAYCIEPSPKSFKNIHKAMARAIREDNSIGEFLHLYHVAAGSASNEVLQFKSTGGTGDHVGEFDMWNMKPGKDPEDWPENKKGEIVEVPSLRLDDIIYNNSVKPDMKDIEGAVDPPKIDKVWALKVDTQGFEPHVFAGLTKSIEDRKIRYIMTEYWPNGIGLLNNRTDKCDFAVEMLNTLISAGYTLYALPIEVHGSMHHLLRGVKHQDEIKNRPLHDLKADCEYIVDLEKRLANEEYHMGFWTDYLAIAPGVEPIEPKAFGRV